MCTFQKVSESIIHIYMSARGARNARTAAVYAGCRRFGGVLALQASTGTGGECARNIRDDVVPRQEAPTGNTQYLGHSFRSPLSHLMPQRAHPKNKVHSFAHADTVYCVSQCAPGAQQAPPAMSSYTCGNGTIRDNPLREVWTGLQPNTVSSKDRLLDAYAFMYITWSIDADNHEDVARFETLQSVLTVFYWFEPPHQTLADIFTATGSIHLLPIHSLKNNIPSTCI